MPFWGEGRGKGRFVEDGGDGGRGGPRWGVVGDGKRGYSSVQGFVGERGGGGGGVGRSCLGGIARCNGLGEGWLESMVEREGEGASSGHCGLAVRVGLSRSLMDEQALARKGLNGSMCVAIVVGEIQLKSVSSEWAPKSLADARRDRFCKA